MGSQWIPRKASAGSQDVSLGRQYWPQSAAKWAETKSQACLWEHGQVCLLPGFWVGRITPGLAERDWCQFAGLLLDLLVD